MKNYKVAGSSVESFFGQYCVDPESKDYSFQDEQDEKITEWGILGQRLQGKRTKWYNHMSAREIQKELGEDKFAEYLKFCVVRNPYECMVSSYFFQGAKGTFKEYCKKFRVAPCSNLPRLLLNNVPVCQMYIRYENLVEDMKLVLHRLNIQNYDLQQLPTHKSNLTPRGKHYREYYDAETRDIVKALFQTEIAMFQYTFD